ncbi:MAG TPA: HesA/MoeB/ThiF family protein, partial [Gallionellaceae bacterium]
RTVAEINPEVHVHCVAEHVEAERLHQLVAQADVVLDCSDNFDTRYAVNRACIELQKPLVSGAATRFSGQVTVFDLRQAESPCYHCLFPQDGETEETRCAIMGVFAPLVGVIGSLQAAEALKLLLEAGTDLSGRLLLLDILHMDVRTIRLGRDRSCPACSGRQPNAQAGR